MRGKGKKIFIVMGTCNGASFIREQVESLLQQTTTFSSLVIRDDLSQDGTVNILKEMAAQDSRIVIIPNNNRKLGFLRNYETLLEYAFRQGCDYVFLSDQDDIWLPEKNEVLFEKMRKMEHLSGQETPLLVYSDLELVARDLKPIYPSFMRFMGYHNETDEPIKPLLAQNYITACTMLANRPLLKIALPIPPEAIIHDWWLALIAASGGRIGFVNRPMVKYRQHGQNVIGARPYWKRLDSPGKGFRQTKFLRDRIAQARSLSERISNCRECLGGPALKTISEYGRILSYNRLSRIKKIRQWGIHCQGAGRTMYFCLLLLWAKNSGESRKA